MSPLATSKCAWRVLMGLAAITSLLLMAGCGSSGSSVVVKGGFTNASLKGAYAYTHKGYGLNLNGSAGAFFVEGGVLTADGNGNITGTDDFIQESGLATQPYLGNAITGTYSINSDGTGIMTFVFGGALLGLSEEFAITLSDSGDFYMEEADGGGTSAGSAHLQSSSATPSGTFVFRAHDVQRSATMGAVSISAGAVSGTYVTVQNGTPTLSIIGAGSTITAPTGGRGSLTLVVNGTTADTAEYYVVSPSEFLLLDTFSQVLSVGMAEQQSAITFSATSLSGSYAFGSSGETTTPGFVNTVGVFTTDGTANVTAANYDSVQDGSVSSDVTTTGTYFINPDGSGAVTLGGLKREIWMVSPARAYLIALNGNNVEDGTLDQQSGTFTNTSLSTQAAFFMDGFNWNGVVFNDVAFEDRVGTLVPSGSDSLGTNYEASFFAPNALAGTFSSNAFSGTFSVASNGRTTTQLNGFTNNIVLYLTTNSTGYLLQADTGINLSGTLKAQTQ